MVHLRIVAPAETSARALELLRAADTVCNVIHLAGASTKPAGDLILADVASEEASVIVGDLSELDIPAKGSIALTPIEAQLSAGAERAKRRAAGLPSDAVIWEDVESRAEEMTELSATFLAFMVLAMMIAAIGLILDQPILIVGAMVVGPEFGPLAALCVGLVQRRGALVRQSLRALAVGFPIGIAVTLALALVLDAAGQVPDGFDPSDHPLTSFVSRPDELSFLVALIAGTAGVLALTSAKSGALVGVLISVTTIPAGANVGVAAAFGEWGEAGGAAVQLAINLLAIVIAGVSTLYVERRVYLARRVRHLSDPSRIGAGLPVGHSRHVRPAPRD